MESAIWVAIEEFPNYEINRAGQIREVNSGIVLSHQFFGDGTHFVALIDTNGNEIKVPVDILVATTFLPKKYVNSTEVIHIDGKKDNCSVDNLAWVDDDSAEKAYYKNHNVEKPAEYFRFYPLMEFPDSQYEINKMGQLRNKYTHKILKGAIHDGYQAFTIRIDNKTIFRVAHIMVAKQFIPNPENKPYVNHIDEDRSNPCIDNLEWVTGSENIRHGTALDRGNLGRNKLINEYNLNGRYVRTWKSIKHLADFFDSLYPSRRSKSHKSCLQYFLTLNKQSNTEKIQFANRIFTYYEGNCDDLEYFTIRETKHRWTHGYTLDGIDVPSQYLAENVKDTVDCITVLQAMPISFPLNNSQKQAIKYAIECIKKVKENETVMNKISSIIHDYHSLKL